MARLEVVEVHLAGKVYNDVDAAFNALGERARNALGPQLTRQARSDMMWSLLRIFSAIRNKHGNPWNGRAPTTGSPDLLQRSGRGLRDIVAGLTTRGSFTNEIEGIIPIRGYMAVHEENTLVTKSPGWMTIPLPAALDSRGLPLRPRARDWPNTFVRRSKRGRLIIFQRRGREIVPLYLLRNQVFIPKRLDTFGHMEDEVTHFEARLMDTLEDHLERML